MSANNDFAFEAVLRESAAAAAFDLNSASAGNEQTAREASSSNGVTAFSVFAGLGIISAVVFVTGYSALMSDTPAIWIHRLMALTVAQSILIAAVAMKLLPLIERRHFTVRIASPFSARQMPLLEKREMPEERSEPLPPPLPQRAPVIGGKLAGRDFLEFNDGSIEIDTLVGRRRFVSLDAAREFVGA